MKIKAAVLNKMGVEAPYAKSKPLAIEELELTIPGVTGRCWSRLPPQACAIRIFP